MGNPYPALWQDSENVLGRLQGDLTFTDPANQPGGGTGSVTSVAAGDSSITIGGTPTIAPTVAVAGLGVTTSKLANLAVTQGKLALAAVNAAQMDSTGASAGWVPVANGSGAVAWAASPGVNSVAAADTSIVVGGTAQAPTVRTGTLDVIATQHPPVAAVPLNSQKITGLANGASASDAAAFGQIPTALPPNGSASGDLSGSYPGPTVAAIQGVAVSGTAPSANQVLTASDATHAAWAAPSGASPLTTKGDIFGHSTVDARIPVGTDGQVLTADSAQALGVKWAAAGTATTTLVRSARASNTILAAGDNMTAVVATAAYTQTLTAAATLGNGWWCVIQNGTTAGTAALVIDPNGAETIDGLSTLTMYSGDTRLLLCDGSNFFTVLLEGGCALFTSSGSFVLPAGATTLDVVCIGGGGQGAGGGSSNSAVAGTVLGGSGGGGGAISRVSMLASRVGSPGASVTVTVGAGGSAGGGGGAASANGQTHRGANGSDGGLTSFGTLLKAGGGGGGIAQTSANSCLGGGGGSQINSATGSTAGTPSAAAPLSGQGATSVSGGTAGNSADWGGASGGGTVIGTGAGSAAGSAIFGGPAGGGGAGANTPSTPFAGGAGGANLSYSAGGGAAAGTSGASPTDGSAGGSTQSPFCGGGGGGGGSGTGGANGGNGGAGGPGAGGGGGGAAVMSGSGTSGTGGNGGTGGGGECRVCYA